jgi:glycosyltransferase involved in cell wall biosynthesis
MDGHRDSHGGRPGYSRLVGVTRRVVLLRGVHASRHLRAWTRLGPGYEPSVLVSGRNVYDVDRLPMTKVPVRTIGERWPTRIPGAVARRFVGDRYTGLAEHLRGADIVHSFDIGSWFSWQAATLRSELGFRLVITVWETVPFLAGGRSPRVRRYQDTVLEAADLFLAATERARDALLLEGAPADRIRILNPAGLNIERFAPARVRDAADPRPTLLSVGRLVWEKGHQDVVRAAALLRQEGQGDVRVVIVGTGPEEARLRALAGELQIADAVEFAGAVSYDDMPGVYARADCLVLASLPLPDWEEQFGWVLAEAMASHLPIVAASSGAIPEVVGDDGALFAAGDWPALARALANGPLAEAPGARRAPNPKRLEELSVSAAGARLRAAYDRLCAEGGPSGDYEVR